MTIKFKRNGKDVIYTEEELLTFSREKIKSIKENSSLVFFFCYNICR